MRHRLIVLALFGIGVLIVYTFKNRAHDSNKKPIAVTAEISLAPTPTIIRQKARISYVIDGDTVVLKSGEKVRLIGIDAAELSSTYQVEQIRHLPQCFANEAKNLLSQLVLNQEIELEKDVSETDTYGRLLRYVYQDSVFLNAFLVEQGFAKALSIPPDTRYALQFQEAQNEAQKNNRGLWKSCPR